MRISQSLPTTLMAALIALAPAATASAGQVKVSVTNSQPGGGFAFSPVWFGFHDGSFSTFTPGTSAAGTPIQAVAELADTGPISAAFAGNGSQVTVGGAPIGPGTTVTSTLDVADSATNRFLSFASMLVPSNDFFFGNPNPIELFDALGNLASPYTIQVYGRNVWDAGTEVDDPSFGAAFLVGVNIADHVDQPGGSVQLVFGGPTDFTGYLNEIEGRATPYGYDISHLITPDDLIATIRITSVPEPSTLALAALGLATLAAPSLRKRLLRP